MNRNDAHKSDSDPARARQELKYSLHHLTVGTTKKVTEQWSYDPCTKGAPTGPAHTTKCDTCNAIDYTSLNDAMFIYRL